ncbi:unnamed protein product [Rhizoctonia solani]|uniref:Uncharacterized protein n=1 Tax=Rhizoctonia solani TaxID=456999 RepID=A0A8H3BSP3_9AGAM|nr:unnamed protein product [Rhizoctonia solani]
MDTSNDTFDARNRVLASVTPRATNNQHSSNEDTGPLLKAPARPHLGESPTMHDLTGANIMLQVNDVIIKTHEERVSKFAHLNRLVERAREVDPQKDTLTIIVKGDGGLASELLDTFELLRTFSIDKSNNFDPKILVSAARTSAAYENPSLHEFCINKLEGMPRSSMEQVQIARAVGLKSWEERAHKELSEQGKPITKEEALVLGIDTYWQIANMRERQQTENFKKRVKIYVSMILCSCAAVICILWLLYTATTELERLRFRLSSRYCSRHPQP